MPVYLTEPVAQRIVDRAMSIIGRNVNVMDRTGIIIGTGDSDRLHKIHEGAVRVLETGNQYDIDKTNADKLKGVQHGINRPIRFRREVVGVVGVTGTPSDVSQFADLVVMTAELMIENASVMSEIHWNQRQRENIISEMIHGEAESDDLFEVRTRKLGINPHIARVALLFSLKSEQGKDLSVEKVEHIQQLLKYNHPDDLVALICPTQIVLLHTIDDSITWHPDNILKFLKSLMLRIESLGEIQYRVALGRFIPGLRGLPLSYQSAQEAMQLGLELEPEKKLYRYFDFQLDSLLLEHVGSWKGEELRSLAKPLIDVDSRKILRKTLRTYINQHTDANATTKKLHIHRNTLTYRLDKIHQLTGRNPRRFDDLIFLHFALRLYEIQNCAIAQNSHENY
ncbi:sugar diacid recognition domain-containing protein [Endozoicomonas numazuensis]|uniref:CdaR family transcriptional regulator n=1 Tax=Endozoicomonas numazuensis TaxID=1137799 RepID=A0A081NGZ4_9GAMM|nr:sugar diacid recognition domain-containing protein [Endozoicomonas numazuensis]KEQ17717.1 hypothetical protein GZ78_08490 [Endozoicomonas numazuensis]